VTLHFRGKLVQEIDCFPLVLLAEMSIPHGHLDVFVPDLEYGGKLIINGNLRRKVSC
jgi:hypothetical protein